MAVRPNIHRIHKIDDATLVELFERIVSALNAQDNNTSFQISQGLTVSLKEALTQGSKSGRHVFRTASISCSVHTGTEFRLHFFRDLTSESGGRVASAQYDEIQTTFGPDQRSWEKHVDLAIEVLDIIGRLNVVESGDHEDADILHQLMSGFSSQHRQMMDGLNNSFKKLENRRREIDDEIEQKETNRREEHAKALSDLETERAELRLQSHMSERREIYRALTSQAASEVRRSIAPRGAMYARWAVFFTSLLIASASGAFAYTSLLQLGITDDAILRIVRLIDGGTDVTAITDSISQQLAFTDWYLIGRTVLSSLVSISSLVYAASWMRGFYASDIEAAREVNRFNLDLARASWVIETVLEVQHEKKGEVPQAWIDGVTNGLFDDKSTNTEMDDRAQALKSLLAFTAGASFGPEGPRVELNRSGARKLAKSETNTNE